MNFLSVLLINTFFSNTTSLINKSYYSKLLVRSIRVVQTKMCWIHCCLGSPTQKNKRSPKAETNETIFTKRQFYIWFGFVAFQYQPYILRNPNLGSFSPRAISIRENNSTQRHGSTWCKVSKVHYNNYILKYTLQCWVWQSKAMYRNVKFTTEFKIEQ